MQILAYPHKSLITPCDELIEEESIVLGQANFWDEVLALLWFSGDNHLAANQMGYNKSFCVIEPGLLDIEYPILINPSWEPVGHHIIVHETCASFPGLCVPMSRSSKIKLSAKDPLWRPIELEIDGERAYIVQHVVSHLSGLLVSDTTCQTSTKQLQSTRTGGI